MQSLHRVVARLSSAKGVLIPLRNGIEGCPLVASRLFSSASDGGNDGGDELVNLGAGPFDGTSGLDSGAPWSAGVANEDFDGDGGGSDDAQSRVTSEGDELLNELKDEAQSGKMFVDGWGSRFKETCDLVKQAQEPGARGSYLKDSEKDEMFNMHRKNPAVYTIEKLAKDFRVMRQRVHAILFLKELEEQRKKQPFNQSIEKLLDEFPEFYRSRDYEFHVASLSLKPDFKVMPEDWDGTTRDADEVHFEISQKEDEVMYQRFVQNLNFMKKKVAGEVYCHKYSRRRPSEGWKFTVEKMGPRGKRGGGGGWKFVTLPNGSTRPLNELEKMFLQRETPRPSRKILPTYRGS